MGRAVGGQAPVRLVLEVVLRAQRTIDVRESAGMVQEISYSGHPPARADTARWVTALGPPSAISSIVAWTITSRRLRLRS